jgi:hypothetical protein
MMKNRSSAIFTIVTKSYLPFAWTLFASLKKLTNPPRIFCVLVDAAYDSVPQFSAEVSVIHLHDLHIPDREFFCFQYDVVELCTALKPFVFSYLFDAGFDNMTYLDPDIYVYREMVEVDEILNQGANIVLTPHLLAPVSDKLRPTELDIRRTGAYNLGFCAIRASAVTKSFLKWWMDKLHTECIVDLEKGIFVDQSWIDLVPGLFEGVFILRHPGYNVAYWNLAQRKVTVSADGDVSVNGVALVFFHFSGLDPKQPRVLSRYQNRFPNDVSHDAYFLVDSYAGKLLQARHQLNIGDDVSYGYGYFKNGQLIPTVLRRSFLQDEHLRLLMEPDPFQAHRVLRQFDESCRSDGIAPTIVMLAIRNSSMELKAHFPMTSAYDIVRFYDWLAVEGEKWLDPELLTWHLQVALDWKSEKLSRSRSTAPKVATHAGTSAERRVERLFLRFLLRLPEPSALAAYIPLCQSRYGYLLAWRSIAFSQESRGHEHFPKRLILGIGDAIQAMVQGSE